MRSPLMVGLTLLVAAMSAGADKPIPQDAARMAKQSRDRLEWERTTLVGGYDRAGRKDPRWDGPAREAAELAARMLSGQFDPRAVPAAIHAKAKEALDGGCDDPLIRYLHVKNTAPSPDNDKTAFSRKLQEAVDSMASSGQSPYLRAACQLVLVKYRIKKKLTADRADLERRLDEAVSLLPRSMLEDPRGEHWEELWMRHLNGTFAAHRDLSGDLKSAYERVAAGVAKVEGIEPLKLMVKAQYQLLVGQEARGSAAADLVSEKQFQVYEAMLRAARKTLEAAYELNPDEPSLANLMLEVELGIGGGDRGAMEMWFERAMKVNGNDRDACWTKLEWLKPKWYGDDDQMLAFGKQCAATGNSLAGITLFAVDAHFCHAVKLVPKERSLYLRSPEVWKEISDIETKYLEQHPDDHEERSKYALLCLYSRHLAEGHAQFQILGENLTPWQEEPQVPLDFLKMMRQRAADEMAKQSK